jgi:hypothetical protein
MVVQQLLWAEVDGQSLTESVSMRMIQMYWNLLLKFSLLETAGSRLFNIADSAGV